MDVGNCLTIGVGAADTSFYLSGHRLQNALCIQRKYAHRAAGIIGRENYFAVCGYVAGIFAIRSLGIYQLHGSGMFVEFYSADGCCGIVFFRYGVYMITVFRKRKVRRVLYIQRM